MTNRRFPWSATTVNGSVIGFTSIYRVVGTDCAVTVDQANLPEDPDLSTIELHTVLACNRRPATVPDAWRLWLLSGRAKEVFSA